MNFVAFDSEAEVLRHYGRKGRRLTIAGRLRIKLFDDDRGKMVYPEFVVNEIRFDPYGPRGG